MGAERLIVFVKAPRPGLVKTRLAATLGPEPAARAYSLLVAHVFQGLGELSGGEVRFTPDDARDEIRPLAPAGWRLTPQGSGDLGLRLQRAFAEAFEEGAKRAVIIGSDCPEVTATDIRHAWQALRERDLTLGPAVDGGYWLIGLRRPEPSLFLEMPWSTDRVLQETIARAESLGLTVHRLRVLRDVDTIEDWEIFQRAMRNPPEPPES